VPGSGRLTSSQLSWLPWGRRSRRPSEDSDGFRSRSGGKSFWNLLPIPIAAAIVTALFGLWQFFLTGQQHQHDQQLANQQHQHDQQLASQQHAQDLQTARDQERATILQAYIDHMGDLLLNRELTKSTPGSEIRQLARVQTLTVLRSLDADRNRTVLRFLKDAHLIGMQDTVVNLSHADLDGADLSRTDLSGINLNGTDLSGAHLTRADLSGASLYAANLSGADLSNAQLSDAQLTDATLGRADLDNAHLNSAALTDAFLGNASLNGAFLTGTRLNGAILTGSRLHSASLSGAQLNGAKVYGTQLSGADISDADLIATDLTQKQLDSVSSCTYAILSRGLTCDRQPPITLTYWYTESSAEVPVIRNLIHRFEQSHPKIHITAINKNFFQTKAAFVNAAQVGEPPDALRSDVSWVSQLASQGYLLNIDSRISRSDLADYLRVPLSYDYYNGHIYGLPQVTDFLSLLYNKAELKEAGIASPPSTMLNFEADAMKVVHDRRARYGFETDGTSFNLLPFLYAFGGGMLDQRGNILVNNAGSLQGLNFLLKLQDSGVMPSNVNFTTGAISPIADFMSGKAAMIFGGPYNISEILDSSSFRHNPGKLGIAGIPACPAGMPTCHAGQTGSPAGGQSYVISAGTAHPIEAYKFISFMSSRSSQTAIAEANHTLPTRKSAYRNNQVSSERFISEFLHIEPTAVTQPNIPQAADLFDAFDPNTAAALDGVESPAAALNAVADAWRQLLTRS